MQNRARLAGRTLLDLAWRARLVPRSRRFHAFGVGAPKSGTRSLAGLFEHSFRAAHEPDVEPVVAMMDQRVHGRTDGGRLASFFRRRDRRLRLELESSHPTSFFIDVLVREFPDAKFILTIRDCYSWLESVWGQYLRLPQTESMEFWRRMRDAYYRPERFRHAPEERVLAERGLYTLDGYLSFWERHNTQVLTLVPEERLLVVRTHEIARDAERIASFLGVPAAALDTSRSHLNRAESTRGLLWQIDPSFVERKADLYCRPLLARFFPEVRTLEDVRSRGGGGG
jgi:hypothetical protein